MEEKCQNKLEEKRIKIICPCCKNTGYYYEKPNYCAFCGTNLQKNLSQNDVAKIMKVKQNTISQWESGIRIPNVLQGIKLASILETTVESLYK